MRGNELQKLQIITKQARGRFRTPGRVVDSRSTPKRITLGSRTNPMWQAVLWRDPMWRSVPRSPAAKSHITWREPTSWAATTRHVARFQVARFHVAKRREALCGEIPHRVAKSHVARWGSTTRPGVRSRPRACFVIICNFCNSFPLKVVDFGRIRACNYL